MLQTCTRPCFNFAQFTFLTLGEFKAKVKIHSLVEYIVYIGNWANFKSCETEFSQYFSTWQTSLFGESVILLDLCIETCLFI